MTEKDILKKAEELGEAIRKSNEWKGFRKASEELKKNKSVQEQLKSLQEKEKLQDTKLKEGKAIEVSEKQEIKTLEKEISESSTFREFVKSENIYISLMEKIERAIKQGTETD